MVIEIHIVYMEATLDLNIPCLSAWDVFMPFQFYNKEKLP